MPALITESAETFAAAVGAEGRLLGLDVGSKTVGMALSDQGRVIASGIGTLKRAKFSDVRDALADIIERNHVVGLVIGLPRNMDGSAGPRVQATRAFARNLAAHVELPQLHWDERLTTVAAERALIEADTSRRRRAEVIDEVAATLILQTTLDRLAHLS